MNSFASSCEMPSCSREGEGALAVDRAEVDGLGAGAHLGGHLGERHAEDDGRRLPVDVVALAERGGEGGVAGEVRHEPELDLRIVRRHEAGSPAPG